MATFNGTEGNDTLVGGAEGDLIDGNGGNGFLQGGDGTDTVVGGSGSDTMSGNAGNDWVRGGLGNDSVTGGGGQDSFAFADFGAANADNLTDFAGDWDNLQLDVSAFTALGATGRFSAGDVRFFLGTAAHDADDRIVYNTATGQLWYDADGSGGGAAQLVATLQGAPSLNATDIWAFGSATPTPTPTPGAINGTEGDDSLVGTSANDRIFGFGGNDTINGRGGADTMDGGAGDDLYVVNQANDTIVEAQNGGIDTVRAAVDYTLPAWVNNLTLLSTAFSGTGNDIDNLITGNAGDNVLDGLAGNDTLRGGKGNDDLRGGQGDDSLVGAGGNDTLDGGFGLDTLVGGAGDDTYFGWSGTTIVESSGIDTLISGGSIHTLAAGVENLTLRGGFLDVVGNGNELDNVIRNESTASGHMDGGDGNDTLIGNGGDDFIFQLGSGNIGNDVVDGGGGSQLGIGFYSAVTVDFRAGTVTGGGTGGSGGVSFTGIQSVYAGSFDDLLIADGAGRVMSGGWGSDTLLGGAGNDTLSFDEETSGTDSINGGSGVDRLDVRAQDAVTVDLAAGTVQAQAGNSATIANMESAAGGNGNDHLLGNSAANWLNGNLGNDTLDGREGNDTLVGGSSGEANVYVFSVAAGAANADLVQGFTSGQDRLQLAASAFPGIGAIGQLSAGDGRFYAAAGADAAHDADDRIVYNTSTGQLWYDAEGSGGGAAQLVATLQSEDFPAGVASLATTDVFVTGTANPPINGTAGNDTLAGTSNDDTINGLGGNDSIQGLGGGDSLTGGAGEDTIDGGTGPDTMVGGAGDDIYFVDNAADVIVEEENGGIDEAISSVSYGALAPWVNYLTLTGTAVQGLGNEVENRIVGNAASNFLQGYQGDDTLIGNGGNDSMWGYDDNDVLDGGDGNDSLVGGLGDDSISGGAGSDTMAYEAGDDTLDAGGGFDWLDFQHFASSAGIVADMRTGTVNADGTVSFMGVEGLQGTWSADRIIGDAGNDWLSGIGGADTLDAGLGNDTLTGGAAADQFVFSAAPGAANADLITDFVSETDQIVLDASAMPGLGASGNFSAGDARFYAAAGATGGHDADDRVVYNTTTNQLFYDADGSGVATAQLIATLQGGVMPSATDIAVVNGSSTPPSGGSNLTGTTGPDTLIGTAGNDTIYGNSGNDWIEGRGGNDTVSGGSGQDSYVFREHGGANADFVTSFDTEWDMLRFDSGAFSALGGAGHFSSGDARFYSAAGASAGHDADDRVVYNTTTGQLYYDADGAGGADAQLVATIQGAAPVVASDIWVI